MSIRSMWGVLFPGTESVGEVVGFVRDVFRVVERHVDPGIENRTFLCCLLTFGISVTIMIHRMSSTPAQALRTSWIIFGLVHIFMAVVMGLKWWLFPLANWLMITRRTGCLIVILVIVTFLTGWGDHCTVAGALVRGTISTWLGSNQTSGWRTLSAWITFGLLLSPLVIAFL